MAITKLKVKRKMGPKPVLEGLKEGKDYKLIPLTQGKWAIVDVDMFDYLNQWNWSYSGTNRNKYALRWAGQGVPRKIMHREIIGKVPEDKVVDHINHDGLDNRKSNLRILTNQQNLYNTKAKGYSWHKARGKWKVDLSMGRLGSKVSVYVGSYDTEEEARAAYLEVRKEWAGI